MQEEVVEEVASDISDAIQKVMLPGYAKITLCFSD